VFPGGDACSALFSQLLHSIDYKNMLLRRACIQAAKSICIFTEVRSHGNEIKHFRKPKIQTFQGVALEISTLKCFYSLDFEMYFCHARHETRIKKKNGRTLISKNPNAAELKVLGKTPVGREMLKV
jgi:hypothetical protein